MSQSDREKALKQAGEYGFAGTLRENCAQAILRAKADGLWEALRLWREGPYDWRRSAAEAAAELEKEAERG